MVDFIIVIISLLITLFWGLKKSDHIRNFKDFAISDSPLSTPLIIATMFATVVGSASTVGFAEKIFRHGIHYLVLIPGVIIGYLITAFFVSSRFKQFDGKLSTGDIMSVYYGTQGKIISGLFGTCFSIGLVAAQISAMGYLFFYFFGVSYAFGVLLSSTIIILYSYTGGIKAVAFTDGLQFCILIVAIPIIGGLALIEIGGIKELWSHLPAGHKNILPSNDNLTSILSLSLLFVIPQLAPSVTQRLLMARNMEQIRDSISYVSILILPFFIIVTFIGLTAYYLNPNLNPNNTLFYITDTIMPIGIKGFVITGILSVIMSTADSDLNAASISITHDFITPIAKKFNLELNELKIAKWATVIIGFTSVIVAINFKNIFDLIVSSLSLWVPSIMAPLLGSIFGIRVSKRMFLLIIFIGLTTYYLWDLFLLTQTGINSALIGFLISSLVLILFRIKDIDTKNIHFNNDIRSSKIVKFKNYFIKNLKLFSQIKIKDNSAQYFAFSAFSIIAYIVPLYIWPYESSPSYLSLKLLLIIASFSSFLLLMKDVWPSFLKQLLPLYWYISLLYCLPFLTTFIFISTDINVISTAQLILGVFVLALLVNWTLMLSIIIIGSFSAIIICLYFVNNTESIFNEHYIWPLFIYILSVFSATLFSRNREIQVKKKLEFLKMTGGSIAHEIRTPLSIIILRINALEKKSKTKDLSFDEISQFTQDIKLSIKNTHHLISMFLENLNNNKLINKTPLLINEIVKNALKEYPLTKEEEANINLIISKDYKIVGDFNIIRNIIWNILKNALCQIKIHNRGNITITTRRNGNYVKLSIKDTAQGIPKEDQSKIFDLFHTKTKHGTGIGLAFCKNAMQQHNGTIELNSKHGEYAEFVLTFPIIN